MPVLEPVLTYKVLLPADSDVHSMYLKLKQLEEEEPLLHIVWNDHLKEIRLQLMGEVQMEVLSRLVAERFGVAVDFASGNILYKETIAGPVIGVGHFEPLRHYAEVHLLLEPGESGSGLVFDSSVSEDDLDKNGSG
jgi:translation elongation factor EF-G